MPKIPGPESLGKRPGFNPTSAVATIDPKAPAAPQLRTPIGANDDEARAKMKLGAEEIALGGTIEGMSNAWIANNEAEAKRLSLAAAHEQERQDTLRAEDAYNNLRNRQLDLTTGQGGYATLKGGAAVNQPILKTYTEQFEGAAQEISQGLGNDQQRQLFARRAAVAQLQFKEGILHHVIAENDTYSTEVFKGIVETETRAAVTNWASAPDVNTSVERVNAAVAARAERGNWPAQYTEAVRLKEVGDIHAAVIGEAIATGNIAYAQGWFKDHQAEIDKPTATRLEQAVRDGTQRQKAATYQSMFLQAHDSLPGLSELERRVQADGTLDDTRKNALIGSILGRRDTLNASLDRQDAKNERAQARREHQIERSIDRVRGMLAYGEPSMEQLEPLITASRGTALAPEVSALINTANATRQFRFAPAIVQENMLTQLRATARTDPTKVDVQMLNTLQGIYDGQQRQLKESGIKFVVGQGLVRPDNPAVAPLDTSAPQKMASLPARLQLARAITEQYPGTPLKPLTPEEKDTAVATLSAGTTAQRRDWFAQLASAAGDDLKGYAAVVAQIAPDKPVLAIAGIAANRRYDDGQGKLVADLMLRGEEILNPPPRADGKPDGGKLLPMPAEQKMRLDFDNTVRDAFAGNPRARSDYYQAARAIYAARSIDAGDKDTTVLNGDRWAESMRLAMGPIENYNGRRTVLPWGMTIGKFKDGLSDRVNLLASAGKLPEGLTPGRLRDLPLEPVGDGKYVFRSGDSVIVESSARPHPLASGLLAPPQDEARFGQRQDGTPKGRGFLGVLQRPDRTGVMTEYTVGVRVAGKEMDVPTLVPTLTREEVHTILNIKDGEELPRTIIEKAQAHAEARVKAGRSVFAESGETPVPYATGAKPIVIDFNQALPWIPSGDRARIGAAQPTQAELDEANRAARARVRPKQ